MSEKKPGLIKRLFRFGSKKDKPDAAEEIASLEESRAAEEAASQKAAEAERLAKEQLEQEETARLAAEEAAKRAEAERIAAEELATQKLAQAKRLEAERRETEAKQKAEEEVARLAKIAREEELTQLAEAERIAKHKAETRRLEAEKRAADDAERKAAKQIAQEEQERLEAEAAAEKERLEAEQVKAEQRENEQKEQAKRDAEEAEQKRVEIEEAKRLAAEAEEKAESARHEAERLAQEEAAELPEPEAKPETLPVKKRGWLTRMREGLSRSSSQLTENITSVFTKRKLDEDTLQDLEDILIQADLGVDTAMNITDALASQRMGKDISDDEVRGFMAEEIEKVLNPVAKELELDLDHTPHVILVVGVNGSGKTTTIGKISQKLYDAGFSTLLVAGDTFRAAAIEQLKIWGDRTQSPVVSRPLGSDAAGLAYDAYSQALDEGRDVMLMDTAGRLQNKTELMDELEKIIRVLKKHDPTAPHTVLLTLDATTGQNALSQVEAFKDVAGVNGLVMTKMDGTARGGIIVAIASKFKLPVYFIGVGEQVDDLEPFEAREFARLIAGLAPDQDSDQN